MIDVVLRRLLTPGCSFDDARLTLHGYSPLAAQVQTPLDMTDRDFVGAFQGILLGGKAIAVVMKNCCTV